MLRLTTHLKKYHFGARDGQIGRVHDLLFEEPTWAVRYLVADTGGWLTGRRTLLSPYAFRAVNDEAKLIDTNLTKSQIENAPPITADEPVSRQYERRYYAHYNWPGYFYGPALWGPVTYPMGYEGSAPPPVEEERAAGESRLRSADEVSGYAIHATDGDLGEVDDFVIDDRDWVVRYLLIDTRRWLPGKKVLIAPTWVDEISWSRSHVRVPLDRRTIKEAPEFDARQPITREYEARLHDHYRFAGYWANEAT